MIDTDKLPIRWEVESLSELCVLNPKHDKNLSDDLDVSFIPMAAVDEKTGTISPDVECRKLGKVRKGYTHFADGDVIFAKITPCMENGKSAIAKNLCNGLACGSTEFYTLRSYGAISPQYLHSFLRQNSYIHNAAMNMTGVVGQRRVPKDFILSTRIPLPPLNEQKRIVTKIEALQTRSTAVKQELKAIKPLLNQFRQSVLAAAFRGDLTKDWREQNNGT
ncbi:restriction endonuclease subunit S [Pleurocapsa sp. CCALA 161]|uniref:restriction endonuclease subunit S n=1 Tax=Pleurocapsa sp. CCALA 161 TaxID=2107688 RepID=UPI001304D1E0|nr:restriction endonuclease subunit S [Pleurocapsa sp. CCALA 161]